MGFFNVAQGKMMVNNESEGMWKETNVAYSKVLSQNQPKS
jgi:hypothetical protein